MGKTLHVTTKPKVGVALLISDKVDVKTELLEMKGNNDKGVDLGRHTCNVPNNRASKWRK